MKHLGEGKTSEKGESALELQNGKAIWAQLIWQFFSFSLVADERGSSGKSLLNFPRFHVNFHKTFSPVAFKSCIDQDVENSLALKQTLIIR
jgi:hypothetical protein